MKNKHIKPAETGDFNRNTELISQGYGFFFCPQISGARLNYAFNDKRTPAYYNENHNEQQTITTTGGSNMTTTYNDVPEVERETADGIRTVSLLTDALTGRKVFLFGNIDENLVFSFTMQMLNLMEDEQSEINIYINSPGGEVNAGLAIYDLIQSCRAPINMYCVGMAASMGAVIFAGGQKGRRFILPHSKVMIHEPLIPLGVGGSVSSVKNTADLMMQTRQELNEILAKHTGKSIEEINRATEYNNYMDAKEAVAFGICDWVTDDLM